MKKLNALVYGATGGLGSAICRKLKKTDTNLFLIARSQNKLKRLADELELKASQTFCVKTITSEKDYKKTNQWIKNLQLEFDYGIHAAGQGLMKKAFKLTLKEWNELIDINLNSAFSFFKLLWGARCQENCELVYFSSASLNQVWPKNGLYGASKAGLEAFLQSLQQEIKNEGGRVWLYKPGSVNTSFFDRVKQHLPKEKMLKAEDIAEIVVENLKISPRIYFPIIPILSD